MNDSYDEKKHKQYGLFIEKESAKNHRDRKKERTE